MASFKYDTVLKAAAEYIKRRYGDNPPPDVPSAEEIAKLYHGSGLTVRSYPRGGIVPQMQSQSQGPSQPQRPVRSQGQYGVDDEIQIPDSTDYYVGWRAWGINSRGLLESPSYKRASVWLPGQRTEAYCGSMNADAYYSYRSAYSSAGLGQPRGRPKHHAPGNDGCKCGLYACYPIKNCVFPSGGISMVLGIVKAWGKVIRGTQGFRSQYMQPIAFLEDIPTKDREQAKVKWPAMGGYPAYYWWGSAPSYAHSLELDSLLDLAHQYEVPVIPALGLSHLRSDRVLQAAQEGIKETGRLPCNGMRLMQQWLRDEQTRRGWSEPI